MPQKLDKVKIASVRRLAIREAVKVCTDQLCLCMCVNFNIIVFSSEISWCYSVTFSSFEDGILLLPTSFKKHAWQSCHKAKWCLAKFTYVCDIQNVLPSTVFLVKGFYEGLDAYSIYVDLHICLPCLSF